MKLCRGIQRIHADNGGGGGDYGGNGSGGVVVVYVYGIVYIDSSQNTDEFTLYY